MVGSGMAGAVGLAAEPLGVARSLETSGGVQECEVREAKQGKSLPQHGDWSTIPISYPSLRSWEFTHRTVALPSSAYSCPALFFAN